MNVTFATFDVGSRPDRLPTTRGALVSVARKRTTRQPLAAN